MSSPLEFFVSHGRVFLWLVSPFIVMQFDYFLFSQVSFSLVMFRLLLILSVVLIILSISGISIACLVRVGWILWIGWVSWVYWIVFCRVGGIRSITCRIWVRLCIWIWLAVCFCRSCSWIGCWVSIRCVCWSCVCRIWSIISEIWICSLQPSHFMVCTHIVCLCPIGNPSKQQGNNVTIA